jgi:hypothetical protein
MRSPAVFECCGAFLDEKRARQVASAALCAADRRAAVADHLAFAMRSTDPSARNDTGLVRPKRSAPYWYRRVEEKNESDLVGRSSAQIDAGTTVTSIVLEHQEAR